MEECSEAALAVPWNLSHNDDVIKSYRLINFRGSGGYGYAAENPVVPASAGEGFGVAHDDHRVLRRVQRAQERPHMLLL